MASNCNVLRCGLCGHETPFQMDRCEKCDYPDLTLFTYAPQDYCSRYGHDGGTTRLENSKITSKKVNIYEYGKFIPVSYNYIFRCARCGFEHIERRDMEERIK